jgi:hypothetical protein
LGGSAAGGPPSATLHMIFKSYLNKLTKFLFTSHSRNNRLKGRDGDT